MKLSKISVSDKRNILRKKGYPKVYDFIAPRGGSVS